MPPFRHWALVLAFTLHPAAAQLGTGEVRLQVTDASGLGVSARGRLSSQANQFSHAFTSADDGTQVVKGIPFGVYALAIERGGFVPVSRSLEIRSEVPLTLRISLELAPLNTAVLVKDAETLLDPHRPGAVNYLGPQELRDRPASAPGRSVLDMVDTQPGWLLEANGVLHPRGSEYQVQYVVDGIPLLDNRSPAFAQSLGIEEFESLDIRTAGYPAEFGRKLGGVIEVTTTRNSRQGLHGNAAFQGGSFDALNGFLGLQYMQRKTSAGLSAEGFRTDRYLDPPVEQNYTNHGSGEGFSGRLERDWNDSDRTRFYFHRRRTGFLVPNERLQQEVGQRQDRTASEMLEQVSHQHVFSSHWIANFRLMVRDTSAALWSNSLSTPIAPAQDRGFRESYWNATASGHYGAHEIKAGAEATFSSIHENFAYTISKYQVDGVGIFDPDLPPQFAFSQRAQDREQGLFVQDLIRIGKLTLSAGVRYDHYRLAVDESAASPRLAASWFVPRAALVVHAAFDRTFQTPAVENVLLASANLVPSLGGSGVSLPLRPGRGNFYEAGISKTVFGKLRLDANWFRRRLSNFADDNLLLNTGVSFPIAFSGAVVNGYEAKIEVPRWGPLSGYASYANLNGRGQFPIAGGLFLGNDVEGLLRSTLWFPITQDQRNTARARIRAQLLPRLWVAAAGRYDSGLPVQIDGSDDQDFLTRQYGQRILSRVNFDKGRVRPSSSIDASLGLDLVKREGRAVRLQTDLFNLANRLSVINFAGLLSGTAVAPGRSFAMRLQLQF